MLNPYFSNIAETIALLLATAQREVLVAVAWLTHPQLTDALANCAVRGCRVAVIINEDGINAAYCPVGALRGRGVQVMLHPKVGEFAPLMHHKFCVIDGHTTITGSFNWTRKAELNQENIIVLQNDTVFAKQYSDTFKSLAEQLGQVLEHGLVRSPLYDHYKWRIELLEAEVAALQAETSDVQGLIRRFEQAYWARLGQLLREIAGYKAQLAEQQAQRTQKRADQTTAEQARRQFEQYSAEAEAAAPPRPGLGEEAAQHLRDLFRKIVKKIHPDRYVNDPELYQRANDLMAETNAAYQAQDQAALQDLLDRLENGLANADRLPDNLDRLEQMAEALARRRDDLLRQLAALKLQNNYLIAQSPDWEAFFAQEEVRLRAETGQLRQAMEKMASGNAPAQP